MEAGNAWVGKVWRCSSPLDAQARIGISSALKFANCQEIHRS